MALDPITALTNLAGKVFDAVLPDPEAKAAANLKLLELTQKGELSEMAERSSIIRAEAQSQSWLATNWRPLTMMNFCFILTARMFGYTAPGISEAEYLKLWTLLEIGIGGYIAGRSIEKIAPTITKALKK